MATIVTQHPVASREELLNARLELLEAEKAHTRAGDELARRRQQLAWVKIEKDYEFDTDEGRASLSELFRGRSQLLVYHFMFGPNYQAGCPSCSAIADGFNGFATHLAHHDVMLWAVSRAPLPKLQAFKRRMGWTFPWASADDNGFNADFRVYATEDQQRIGDHEYNFQLGSPLPRTVGEWPARSAAQTGAGFPDYVREKPGMSAFRVRGRRGLSHLLGVRARPR